MSQNNSHPDDDATLVYRTGDIIFEVGDIGTESYEIIQGEVSVIIGYGPMPLRKQACLLDTGSFFGSMALSSESRARTATCIAAGQGPTVLQIVARVPIKIAVPSLASLLVAKEQRPPKKSENKKYKHGDFVLEQGDSADNTYYVLVTGCLNVIVDSKIVGTIMQTGEVFGESCCCALAEDKVRTASVRVKSLSGAIVSVWQYDPKNDPGLSSMLHRRRKEILKKNHLREFNCQTERSKSSSSMLLNLRSSIATARPSTLKSNKTNDDASPSPTKWNFLRNKFSKAGKQGAKKEPSSKWNVLRRMVVQSGTSSRLMHSCTSLNDLTDSAKTNLLDQQAAETGKAVLAVRERKKQDLQLEHKKERQRKERDDKKMEEEQEQKRKEKEKKTIDHQGSEKQMNIVRLDLPAVVEPRRDAVHEQVKTDEGRFIVDAKEQERMWEEIIQRKAMGEKNVSIVAKHPTKTKPQKKQKKHPQKAFVPVVPKKQPKSIVVTKRKKKKKIPDQVKVEAKAVKRTKKKHVPVVREEIVEKIVVEKIEAMPMVTVTAMVQVHEVKEVEEPRTLRLSVTAADVKRSIEAYRKAIHQRSENILNMQYTKRQGGAISPTSTSTASTSTVHKIGMLEIQEIHVPPVKE